VTQRGAVSAGAAPPCPWRSLWQSCRSALSSFDPEVASSIPRRRSLWSCPSSLMSSLDLTSCASRTPTHQIRGAAVIPMLSRGKAARWRVPRQEPAPPAVNVDGQAPNSQELNFRPQNQAAASGTSAALNALDETVDDRRGRKPAAPITTAASPTRQHQPECRCSRGAAAGVTRPHKALRSRGDRPSSSTTEGPVLARSPQASEGASAECDHERESVGVIPSPRQQRSRRAPGTIGSPRLSGSHLARGRRRAPRYRFSDGIDRP